MSNHMLHDKILEKSQILNDWFKAQTSQLAFPIYLSVDVRDSGFKTVSVDANIYPAGFNNICGVDRENGPEILEKYIQDHYKFPVKNILLITEEHTNNAYYWENVHALATMIRATGRNLRITMPKNIDTAFEMETSTGQKVLVSASQRKGDTILVDGDFVPDLVISNNDFSLAYEDWSQGLDVVMNPPRELGWYQRKKSTHFEYYNQIAKDFSDILQIDPWLIQVDTQVFTGYDGSSEKSKKALAAMADEMLERIRKQYEARGIKDKPVVFIKNNAGTYGLAVTRVESGAEVMQWNNRARTKMKAAKGGREVEEFIVQEGVPTSVTSEGSTAEPAIYLLGSCLLGGFLRTHGEKSATESLNSPGAVYKRLCVSDLVVDPGKCPLENVYGWIAKISTLAVGLEAKSMGVNFKKYTT